MFRKHFLLLPILVLWCHLGILSAFDAAMAQGIPPPDENSESESQTVYDYLVGQPAQNGIYLGMWSVHIIDDDDEYTTTHNLLGLVYKGLFLGTFLNSHDDRSWAVGLQRDLYGTNWQSISVEMGYRLGVMYGYENLQLFDSQLFPLLQLYADLSYEQVGVQVSWAGSVFAAGFFIRF